MGGNNLMLTAGSICAGMGGLEMGISEVIPLTLRWVTEYEPPTEKNPNPRQAAAQLLAHRHPTVPNLGDITAVHWPGTPPVDVICGGTPCQDMSAAGLRSGMRAGTRSGIWGSMVEAIATHRPALVVWENVRGALSARADSSVESCPICMGDERECNLRALGRVLGDLADLGYDAAWCGLRAADVGAPHARFRIFVLAWPADPEGTRLEKPGSGRNESQVTGPQFLALPAADADSLGQVRSRNPRRGRQRPAHHGHPVPDTTGDGRHERRPEPAGHLGGSDAALGGADAVHPGVGS
jgi:DNA (cytosine-5)-methyltransferase 1